MNVMKRYPLASFFVLAFLITWTFQLTAIALAPSQGMTLSNETNFLYWVDLLTLRLSAAQTLILALFGLGAGPLFAAVLVTWATEGKAGLRELWAQCTRWKIGLHWYVIAFILPLLLSLASLGIGLLASDGQLSYSPKVPGVYFLPFFLYILVFTGIAEEPGWRGFALPRLQRRYSAEKASWILGVLWGVWHFPFIFYFTYSMGIIPMVVSFVALTFGIVGWTLVLTWLYNNTHSVWLIILLHGWGNIVQSYLVLSSDNMAAQGIYGFLPWLIAIVLLWRYGKVNLAPHLRPQS